jgi:putative protease
MNEQTPIHSPLILAPAGNKDAFLAALAAGADAVYCGLKCFSARMEAKNFTIDELILLTRLAHKKSVKVFITLNALLKPCDLDKVTLLLADLESKVKPDAIIIQDMALLELAKQVGFSGEIHLSTLANISFPTALQAICKKTGVSRVVLPRELNIDEIKAMALACPKEMSLEVFIHGALCYGVSGRCYWSSFLGGKSGLRGTCVQPCRRKYDFVNSSGRFFSCVDLGLDVLVKVLLNIPQITCWKIEGRKKGPHYVYYTVTAYKLLRDHGNDPQLKKTAVQLLKYALGRPTTHYYFLPQRLQNPVQISSQTGSGLLIGTISGTKQKPYITAREDLLSGDMLRIGYEDEPWHRVLKVGRAVPKKGRFYIKLTPGTLPIKGSPVFLIDRRENNLEKMLSCLDNELNTLNGFEERTVDRPKNHQFVLKTGKKSKALKPFIVQGKPVDQHVFRKHDPNFKYVHSGFWLSDVENQSHYKHLAKKNWWWLPHVIWPENEKAIKNQIDFILDNNGRNFVLNAPWQMAFFSDLNPLNVWAGPFCNLSNPLAINQLSLFGFSGAIVSPELGKNDFLLLPEQCSLPLGIVISGNWPLCVSRVLSNQITTDQPFCSPKKEYAWIKKYDTDFWIYPNWPIDLNEKRDLLERSGYHMFVHLVEPVPKDIPIKKRKGLWNWDIDLK